MENKKYVKAIELAKLLNVSRAYISKKIKDGTLKNCIKDELINIDLASKVLGKKLTSEDNTQEEVKKPKIPQPPKTKTTPPKENTQNTTEEDIDRDFLTLEREIFDKMSDEDLTLDKALWAGLQGKANTIRKLYEAREARLRYKQLKDDMFDKNEITKIFSFTISTVRNALIDMANNYSVALEGLDKKHIKEYVEKDTNRILNILQNAGDKFVED